MAQEGEEEDEEAAEGEEDEDAEESIDLDEDEFVADEDMDEDEGLDETLPESAVKVRSCVKQCLSEGKGKESLDKDDIIFIEYWVPSEGPTIVCPF